MKKLITFSLGCCLLSGTGFVVAQPRQNPDGTTNPPKVLLIMREFLKPGRQGSMHVKSESAFVRAMEAAKYPTHYFAMNAMSGQPRSLFIVGYDSFADMEKDNDAMMHNKALAAEFDHDAMVDGDLLNSSDQSVWTFDEDSSVHPAVKIEQMRYMELTSIKVKLGHIAEWKELVKMYRQGYENVEGAHAAVFESQYGTDNGNLFLVATPMRSLSEVDDEAAQGKAFQAALGEDGLKRFRELSASCLESLQTNLFEMSPSMSYVPDAWIQANPSFWKKAAAAPAKKEAAKAKQ